MARWSARRAVKKHPIQLATAVGRRTPHRRGGGLGAPAPCPRGPCLRRAVTSSTHLMVRSTMRSQHCMRHATLLIQLLAFGGCHCNLRWVTRIWPVRSWRL
eukprot:11197010-Lingulodinium_polyedra.AAC.1